MICHLKHIIIQNIKLHKSEKVYIRERGLIMKLERLATEKEQYDHIGIQKDCINIWEDGIRSHGGKVHMNGGMSTWN